MMKKYKILFLTEGGESFGFGHLTRCKALSQALYENGMKSVFYINGDGIALSLIEGIKSKCFDWIQNQKLLFENIKLFDFVVVDSYLANRKLLENIAKKMGCNILSIDDYNRMEYPFGLVVNPSTAGNKVDYPRNNNVKYLLGKEYIILRKEFRDSKKLKVKENLSKVLITLGGTKNIELLKKIADIFDKEIDVDIINPNQKCYSEVEIFQLMKSCDLCISGGGQTLYELVRLNIPTIAVGLAQNQLGNIQSLLELSAIEFAGWHDDENLLKSINKCVESLTNYEKRKKICRSMESIIDGQGSSRLAKEIRKRIENDRK